MDTREKLIQLKENSGFNWKAFAAYFDIPYRTMQDWYMGKRKMPDYLLRLMYYKLGMEIIVGKDMSDCHEGVEYDTADQNR